MSFESSEEQNSDRDGEGGTSHGSVGTQPKLGITEQGVWQLAWPTMAAMGAGTVVRFTDFVMVRDLGSEHFGGGRCWRPVLLVH